MASSTQSILVPRGKESNSDAGSRLTVKFEKVNEISEEFCYIIGIMLGDVNIYKYRKSYYKTDFASSNDKNFIEYVAKIIQNNLGIKVYVHKHTLQNCWYVQNFERKIGKLITSFDIPIGNKTKIVELPKWCWYVPLKLRIKILEGLIDAEGYVCLKKYTIKYKNKTYTYNYPYIEIKTISKNLINDISKILDELKINYSRFLTKRKECKNVEYSITIIGKNVLKLIELHSFSYKLKNLYCKLQTASETGEGQTERL
jgi:hypothetical protein